MIETFDLTKKFNDFTAVDGVTLSVQQGEILALLGQNGAGKTTTVRMLTALLRPTRGWARIAGYDAAQEGDKVRAAVGVLAEQHGLYARMSAWEYLDFFGQAYKLDPAARQARGKSLLEYFGLEEAAHRRIGEYSKGMKQKLALARAMIHNPEALLLDEPTSAMDPESARLVRDEIARLKSTRRAIVLCTHNLSEAEELADKIAIIYRGKILVQGSLEELKQNVLGDPIYEARLSEARDDLPALHLPPGAELVARTETVLSFRVNNPRETNPKLLRALTEASLPLTSFQEAPRGLEQAYLKVMAQARENENAN